MNGDFERNPFRRRVRVIDVLEIAEAVMSENPDNKELSFALGDLIVRIIQKVQDEASAEIYGEGKDLGETGSV